MERDMPKFFSMLWCEKLIMLKYLHVLTGKLGIINNAQVDQSVDEDLLRCKVRVLEMDSQCQGIAGNIGSKAGHQGLTREVEIFRKSVQEGVFYEFDRLTEAVNEINTRVTARHGQARDLIDKSNEILSDMESAANRDSSNALIQRGEPVC
jgi:hypothetical protein